MNNNEMLVNIPVYNYKGYIKQCIESLKEQTYTNWHALVVDDCSTDGTQQILEDLIGNDDRFTLVRNEKNMCAVYNKTYRVKEMNLPEDTIIVGLDGDDMFASKDSLKIINDYFHEDIWVSWGDLDYTCGACRYTRPLDWMAPPRKQPFVFHHIKCYRWFVMKNIKYEDLIYEDGVYLKYPEDWIIMYPCVEMAGQLHCRFINEPLYWYNHGNPISDDKISANDIERKRVSKVIVSMPAYEKKSKLELIKGTCDWKE